MANEEMGEPVRLKTYVNPASGKATTSPTSGSDCNLDFARRCVFYIKSRALCKCPCVKLYAMFRLQSIVYMWKKI